MPSGAEPGSGNASTARLAHVRDTIAKAARQAGRAPDAVTLVAVSKTFGPEDITPVIAAGQRVFGENRVQEAEAKWPTLKSATPGIELHLIGPLQTNKVKQAIALFDVIETLDRPKLAEALARERDRGAELPRLLVQVNTGEEPQKAGIPPLDAEAFVADCRDRLALPVVGLMCIPPVEENPALHFALLRDMAGRVGLPVVSMGMSGDYELAVGLGATHVRVGSAIFGQRSYADTTGQ